MNLWTLADVRFGAHYGLKSDIAPGPKSAINRHRPPFFDHVVSATNGCRNCIVPPWGSRYCQIDVSRWRGDGRSTPSNSKAFEKRRIEIGYAPRIHAKVIPSPQFRD